MASSIVFLFMFLTLTTTINARESQFFAKVSNNIPKQETQQQTLTNTNQQDPTFIPQSQDSGSSYGLYGHGSGQLPPSSTTNTDTYNGLPANLPENYNPVAYTTPIHSSTQDISEENEPQTYKVDNTMYNSEKQEEYMGNNGDNMYNSQKQEEYMGNNGDNMYNYEKQGMSDTRFNGYNSEKQGFNDASLMQTENGGNMYNYENQGDNEMYNSEKQGFNDASFMETENSGNNMYNNQKFGGSEMYNSEKQGFGGYNGNMYNTGKQGMSDTRFLENGKYFYDLNMERANANAMNSRGVRNGFETQGYNGNYENTYDKYNTNGGYQNQGYQVNQYDP